MDLPLIEVPGSERKVCAPDQPWWLGAEGLKKLIEQEQPFPQNSACYQFGDAPLEINTDNARLIDTFAKLYGDCAAVMPAKTVRPRVRCVVRRGGNPPFLLITFIEGAPPDPAAAFLPMRQMRVWNSPSPGWRLAGIGAAPILAACGSHVLIHLLQAWDHLPVEYLVNAALTAQPELVAVHAASLLTKGGGLLLTGPSESGKTTTALHLAARGLTLLGDEVALVRLATKEVLPFRKAANLRRGPREPELAAAVERTVGAREPVADAGGVTALRISRLFPGQDVRPAVLSAVFFLAGFADRPSLVPFRPTLSDLDGFSMLAGNEIATLWGLPPERRALRLLAIKGLVDRLPCRLLTVGAPGDTAEFVERAMEGL